MEQLDASGKTASIIRLLRLVKAAGPDKLCKSVNVFRQEDQVMNKFLVTLVTESGGGTLGISRAFGKDGVPGGATAIGGATEKAFRNVMMPG